MADRHQEPYDEAHVLLLGWEHDDDDNNNNKAMRLGLQKLELVLDRFFNYRTYSEWKIPHEDPTDALNIRLREFRKAYNKRRNLLIIYYAGHGAVDRNRSLLWLLFDNIKYSPRVTWNALQTIFLADTVADVLLIMDCCNALGAFQPGSSVETGNVMLWAACGQTSKTPASGEASFTESLIAVLEDIDEEGREVDELHGDLFYRLDNIQALRKVQERSVPACITISRSQDGRRIRIKKLPRFEGGSQAATGNIVDEADDIASIPAAPPRRDNCRQDIERWEGVIRTPQTLESSGYTFVGGQAWPMRVSSPVDRISEVDAGMDISIPLDQFDFDSFLSEKPSSSVVRDHGPGESGSDSDIVSFRPHNVAYPIAEPVGQERHGEAGDPVTPSPKSPLPLGVQNAMYDLWFADEDSRKLSVGVAYQRTFSWITRHEDFIKWASDSNPLFWVSGKPGSGKSTLMKHLINYGGLQHMLNSWSSGNQVLIVSFFFWASGTTLQRSCEGFLRSLLFQLMDQDNATAIYAAQFLDEATESGAHSPQHLLRVLRHLFEDEPSPMGSKYWCFSVDALDECDDVELLSEIIQVFHSPHIKGCVSSRPWPKFLHDFQTAPQLRLEDLTKEDISSYVLGQLNDSSSVSTLSLGPTSALVDEITYRAQGVFLWATLATENLLRGVDNGDDLQTLQERIWIAPTSLPDFFRMVVMGLTEVGVRTLMIVEASEVDVLDIESGATVQPMLTTTILSFALQFGIESALAQPIRPETKTERSERAQEIATILERETHNLVIANTRGADNLLDDGEAINISYLHKTAKDFFTEYDVGHLLAEFELVDWFDPHLALLKAVVLDLKSRNLDDLVPFTGFTIDALSTLPFWMKIEQAIKYAQATFARYNWNFAEEIVELLDELDRVVQIQVDSWSSHSLHDHWSTLLPLGSSIRLANHGDNFLSFATSCGLSDYVSFKLTRTLKAGKSQVENTVKQGKPLLLYAIQPQPQFASSAGIVDTVAVLFRCGVDPDATFQGESVWRSFLRTYHLHKAKEVESAYTKNLRKIFDLFLQNGAAMDVAPAVAAELRA